MGDQLISTSLLAAIVAAIVSFGTSERRIRIENVTRERAKWRSAVRRIVDGLGSATRDGNASEVDRLCAQLILNLNPFDPEDSSIVRIAIALRSFQGTFSKLNELNVRVSLLLKHDWERAKWEAGWPLFRGPPRKRVPFDEHSAPSCLAPVLKGKWTDRPLPWRDLLGVAVSALLLFWLAASLVEPFQKLIRLVDDPRVPMTTEAWLLVIYSVLAIGFPWIVIYIAFKVFEKRVVDRYVGTK